MIQRLEEGFYLTGKGEKVRVFGQTVREPVFKFVGDVQTKRGNVIRFFSENGIAKLGKDHLLSIREVIKT